MTEPPVSDRTAAYTPTDSLDAALGVAFGPAQSVFAALTHSMPGLRPVHLREPVADDSGVVEKPNSREAPSPGGAGRYQVFGEIARGGMGAILRGRDPDLGREVAVKVLREEHRDNPLILERFVEEAQIGGQLQHPGIVPVYELGQFADKRPFFTMKLVKGRTLAALFADRANPADGRPRLLAVFAQVCHTIAYAHARGVIHRDLKPSNVMIGHFGEVQVMDWGLAKVLAQGGVADDVKTNASRAAPLNLNLTEVKTVRSGSSPAETLAGSLLGTPAYMSPEQARGETALVDERADVFGLGALLCELLTGRPPFLGESQAEVQRKAAVGALDDAFTRLGECGADAELIGLAKKCLAAEPWGRPRDAKIVADAISAYLAATDERLHRAERERAVAEATAVEERKRRRVSLALAGAVVLLLGLGGTAAWWWNDRQTAAAHAAEGALAQADELRDQGHPADALAAVQRAESAMPTRASDALRSRVASTRSDLTLMVALDEVRLRYSNPRVVDSDVTEVYDAVGADNGYAAVFRDYGLDIDAASPADVAARVSAAVREPVSSALDQWAVIKAQDLKDPAGWKKRLEVAQAVDAPDPWRRQLRDARLAKDLKKIEELAASPDRVAQPPTILIHLARQLRDVQSDPKRAAEVLRDAQRQHPEDFWLNFELGETCMRLNGGPPEAARYFAAALAIRPQNVFAMTSLAWALTSSEQFDEATALCRRAIHDRPDFAWPHGLLGYILGHQKRWEDALIPAAEAARLSKKNGNWHNNLGVFQENLKRMTEAEANFRRALELTPNHGYALRNLVDLLKDVKRRAEAEPYLRGALEKGNDDDRVLIELIELLKEQKRPAEVEACLRRDLAKKPDHGFALDSLVKLLKDQGRTTDAVAVLRASVARKPDLVWLRVRLADTSLLPADTDAAIVASQKQLAEKPNAQYSATLSRLLRRRKRWAEAETAAKESMRLAPTEANGYIQLNWLLLDLGRRVEAIEMLQNAAKLIPNDARIHNFIGYHLSDLGRPAESTGPLQRAVMLDPKAPAIYWTSLGFSRMRLGDFAEAREAMIQAGDAERRAKPGDATAGRTPELRAKDMDRLAELAKQIPAMLDGSLKPADAREGVKFGQVCQFRGFPVAAMKFYREAFNGDRKLAQSFDLFQAACGAIELSTSTADPAQATEARQQALDWLRSDLPRVDKAIRGNDARLWINRWRQTELLNPVRDPAALAKLPPDERAAWEQYWKDIEARTAKLKEPEPTEDPMP